MVLLPLAPDPRRSVAPPVCVNPLSEGLHSGLLSLLVTPEMCLELTENQKPQPHLYKTQTFYIQSQDV